MSDLVQLTKAQFTKNDNIAVITINNPPVNALSPGVPEGISAAIDQVDRDDDVIAAVVIGGGRTFVAGADIKEFTKMTSGKGKLGPGLLPLLLKIENCSKPVVMAIHGTAFGGGLGAGHVRPLPRGSANCASWPARSEARPYSRSRRHAAPASSCRSRQSG